MLVAALLAGSASAASASAAAASAAAVPLVRFSDSSPKPLLHSWSALNDPVMGGRSSSRVAVEGAPARLNFTGTCAIVPSLQAPGFITAVTGKGLFRSESFVDVSACEGLTIKARDFSGGYKGYRISFGTAKPIGGKFFAQGYKADLHPPTHAFGEVKIPFTDFTDFWDDATGKAIHTCAEKHDYCPDAKTLRDMKTMSIWAEGVEGTVHLEVEAIDACGCRGAAEGEGEM